MSQQSDTLLSIVMLSQKIHSDFSTVLTYLDHDAMLIGCRFSANQDPLSKWVEKATQRAKGNTQSTVVRSIKDHVSVS